MLARSRNASVTARRPISSWSLNLSSPSAPYSPAEARRASSSRARDLQLSALSAPERQGELLSPGGLPPHPRRPTATERRRGRASQMRQLHPAAHADVP